MTDSRVLLCVLIILTFMAVTVGHVADYAGGFEHDSLHWLGIPYAIAVDASIAVCAWLTRWKGSRRWAWTGYVTFTVASGAMNAAAIEPWLLEWPRWVFAWTYALFPTAAIGLLGFLAQKAEAVAETSHKKRGLAAIGAAVSAWWAQGAPQPTQAGADEPQGTRKPAQADAWPTASLADWRGIAANLDGRRATCDADCVYDALREAQLTPPAERTVQAWARRTREGAL